MELGFTIVPRKSRRMYPTVLTDLYFDNGIALLSNNINQARELLIRVESEKESTKLGLHLNTDKTKVMNFNTLNSIDLIIIHT